MSELVNRYELLSSTLYCGALYSLWRIVVTVFYPFVSGSLWQNVIGPQFIGRYPSAGQSEDLSRPSYLPTEPGQPLVMAWGVFAVSIDDLTHGIRDGLLLGVLYALLPEFMRPEFLTFVLAVVVFKSAWRISDASGPARTDRLFWACREVLMYVGAILALQSTQHFLGYSRYKPTRGRDE